MKSWLNDFVRTGRGLDLPSSRRSQRDLAACFVSVLLQPIDNVVEEFIANLLILKPATKTQAYNPAEYKSDSTQKFAPGLFLCFTFPTVRGIHPGT
jgi:hypothetical protein